MYRWKKGNFGWIGAFVGDSFGSFGCGALGWHGCWGVVCFGRLLGWMMFCFAIKRR